MKRSTIVALILGLVAGVLGIVLHASRVTLGLEEGIAKAIMGGQAPVKVIGVKTQYLLVLLLSLGAAWLGTISQRRKRLLLPVAIFAVEVFAIAWVCLLFQVFFQ